MQQIRYFCTKSYFFMKKVIYMLCAMVALAGCQFGDDDPDETVSSGKYNEVWWRLTRGGRMFIGGKGDMLRYGMTEEPSYWYYGFDRTRVKEVHIEEGVTSVGDFAFFSLHEHGRGSHCGECDKHRPLCLFHEQH